MGSFSIIENDITKSKQIVYRTTYKCEENLNNFTKSSFEEQIESLILNISYMFHLIKKDDE